MGGTALQRHLHHVQGAKHVVQNTFARVGLHHGHVLVGGRMENDIWLDPSKQSIEFSIMEDSSYNKLTLIP